MLNLRARVGSMSVRAINPEKRKSTTLRGAFSGLVSQLGAKSNEIYRIEIAIFLSKSRPNLIHSLVNICPPISNYRFIILSKRDLMVSDFSQSTDLIKISM